MRVVYEVGTRTHTRVSLAQSCDGCFRSAAASPPFSAAVCKGIVFVNVEAASYAAFTQLVEEFAGALARKATALRLTRMPGGPRAYNEA